MTSKKLSPTVKYGIAIVAALVVGGVESFLYLVLNVLSFGLWPCGEEVMTLWYHIFYGFLFLLVFICCHIYVARFFAKKENTQLLSWLFWIFTAINGVMIIYYGTFVFNLSAYYQDFNSAVWKSKKEKPMAMVRTIYEERRFIDKTKEEVVKELGEGDKHPYAYELYYTTDETYSALIFEFRDGKVVKYTLLCLD